MNNEEYLLICLAEECAEVAQAVSKSIRFGLEHINPKFEKSNKSNLNEELVDLYAIVELLTYHGVVDNPQNMHQSILDKIIKVEKYMRISRELGILK